MLALYRSDRQAEALARLPGVSSGSRRGARFGAEPGLQRLERQILEQDPELAVPARKPGPRPARRRAGLFVLVGALLLAAAVGAVAVLLVRDGGSETSPAARRRSRAATRACWIRGQASSWRPSPSERRPRASPSGKGASGCSTPTTGPSRRSIRRSAPSCGRSARARRRPTSLSARARSGSETACARQGLRSRRACPDSVPESAVVDETIPLSRASGPALVWVYAGQPETAHRGDGCRCLGGQSRSERLPDRPADEPGRGGRCRRPGGEHRCGRGRGVDRQRRWRGRRDRSSDERRLEADPGRRREPDRARRRRRRGLGRRSRRRQRLADRPRPGSHPAHHPARGRRRRGRLRRGGGLGDQRARRRGLPHRPGHERSSGRQPDGGTARDRRRRGRRLGHRRPGRRRPRRLSRLRPAASSSTAERAARVSSSRPISRCRASPERPPSP